MYVCVCNAIRECEFRRAAQRCGGDAEMVYATLGKRPNADTAWKKPKRSFRGACSCDAFLLGGLTRTTASRVPDMQAQKP